MNIGEKLQIFDTYLESIEGISDTMKPNIKLLARHALEEAVGESDKLSIETDVASALGMQDLVEKLQWCEKFDEYINTAVNETRAVNIDKAKALLDNLQQTKKFKSDNPDMMICNDPEFIKFINEMVDYLVMRTKVMISDKMKELAHVDGVTNVSSLIQSIILGVPVQINPNDAAHLKRLLNPEMYQGNANFSDVIRSTIFTTIGHVCDQLKPAIREGLAKSNISTANVSLLLGRFIQNIDTLKNRSDVGDLDITRAMDLANLIPNDTTDAINNLRRQQQQLISANDGLMVDKEKLRELQREYNDLEVEIADKQKLGRPRSVVKGSLDSLSSAIRTAQMKAGHTHEYSMMRSNINKAKVIDSFKSGTKRKEVFENFLDEDETRRQEWNTALDILRKCNNPSISDEKLQLLTTEYNEHIDRLINDNDTRFAMAKDAYDKARLDPNQIIRSTGEIDYKTAEITHKIIGSCLASAQNGTPTGQLPVGELSSSESMGKTDKDSIQYTISNIVDIAKNNADEILDLYTAYFFYKKDPSKKLDNLLAIVKKKKGRPDVNPDTVSVAPNPKLFRVDTSTGKYKFIAGSVLVPLHVAYEMSKGWVEYGSSDNSFVIQDNGVDKSGAPINIWSITLIPDDDNWAFKCTVSVKGSQPVILDQDFSANDASMLIQNAFNTLGANPSIN